MQQRLSRLLVVSFAILGAASITASCASSEDGVFDQPQGLQDSGADSDASFSTGGFSGGFGGFSGSFGGSFGGTAATGGFGGFGGSVGGTSGSGGQATCNPSFCPGAVGTTCCLSPTGPCGIDNGMGCTATTPDA